jgi:hypothetical protein
VPSDLATECPWRADLTLAIEIEYGVIRAGTGNIDFIRHVSDEEIPFPVRILTYPTEKKIKIGVRWLRQ